MIDSLLSQTILPCEWVIVDDGSVDETYRIGQDAARGHPWIKVIRKEDRGFRDLGGVWLSLFTMDSGILVKMIFNLSLMSMPMLLLVQIILKLF
jgi:glycosyltransferase involved in cell wall biosynthesis